MANTEGLSDEAMSSLLAMPSSEQEKLQRQHRNVAAVPIGRMKPPSFRRSLARRQQMMELGDGETPAAKVIRSSQAPKVFSSSSKNESYGEAGVAERGDLGQIFNDDGNIDEHNEISNSAIHKPVIMSEYISERPIGAPDDHNKSCSSTTMPRESRFKQRNRYYDELRAPTEGGFPSLDIAPLGTFTRKGRASRVNPSPNTHDKIEGIKSEKNHSSKEIEAKEKFPTFIDLGMASNSMLANMSLEEIREGVEEVQSILSIKSIEFLKKRGREKLAKSKVSSARGRSQHTDRDVSISNDRIGTKHEGIQLEEKIAQERKEKISELLSSVRTPDDMDRVYNEALQMGLAAELPSSAVDTITEVTCGEVAMSDRMKNLHIATCLLRSTVPRQRLLGAKRVCEILEEDAAELAARRRKHTYSGSYDEREPMRSIYPRLLPVAARCLLDESIATYQTTGGRILLSTVLRCIHALVTLFVHPYHVAMISSEAHGCDDPFILYQTCFMCDVSHVPPGTEMYPPIQIRPLDDAVENKATCYRADSSAATAESDSKAFYSDPAWTLLSRMRIVPCLSDALRCLSTESAISAETIRSICGILAMLSLRSQGAAGAIARHKDILPFLVSYCLSPKISSRSDDMEDELFNSGVALPALSLLCHLARQSRDIAELEMPFQSIIPELLAILCVEAESEIQSWSVILLRILLRYGVGVEHVQSLIMMAAPRLEMMRPESDLGAHYLTLFAIICDAAKPLQQIQNHQADECLAMSGAWLSSSVTNCFTSYHKVVNGCSKYHTRLASAQLRFMASYISSAAPTERSHVVPIVSNEACFEVMNATLESNMLENALAIVLRVSFNATWDTIDDSKTQSLEDEAIGCLFVSAYMNFVKLFVKQDASEFFRAKLFTKIINLLEQFAERNHWSITSKGKKFHPARQSWLVEAEFSVLRMLCEASSGLDSIRLLLSTFAFSLAGRLNIGHEAMAEFIFHQDNLFQLGNKIDRTETRATSLQTFFQTELSDHVLQLDHSSNILFLTDLCGPNKGPLNSLRCYAEYCLGRSNNDAEGGRFFLPLGGIWMWNVLSSTIPSQPCGSTGTTTVDQVSLVVVSHTLRLLLQLEAMPNASCYMTSIKNGAKLYHAANVCLLPENILGDGVIRSSLDLLFKRVSGFDSGTLNDSFLANDFIKACFDHSRISKESTKYSSKGDLNAQSQTAQKLYDLLDNEQPLSDGYSKDELKALDDFVDDMCDAYIEYGGQYSIFTNFIRLFLGHDFPAKATTTVLTRLNPILNLLTIEEEERESQLFYLSRSVSSGVWGLDSSRRDPSSNLDSFSSSLKKREKNLSRNDYAYLLAVAVLSRNLVSCSRRCECGLEAMRNRLTGLSDAIFYDIIQVSLKILASGTRDPIMCVFDTCMDSNKGLLVQDGDTQNVWRWNSNGGAVWDRVVNSLKGDT
ncbi:hypothetical protein ACHAXA_002581 [Cyclostephanos tholiformis]|uniref:RNA polymerase II-associated protein 1 n=1 Tax=Cyclostephanos tholiformis TaxID=382380 RepID=A0ABD3R4S0_9STRA